MSRGLPSLEIVQQLLGAERDKQLAHFDALDNKAGVILGFAGLLITLAPDVPAVFRVGGIVLAAVAAVAAVAAFWPRRFPVLDPSRLAEYVAAAQGFTRLTVADTLEVMVAEASELVRRKALGLRVALVSLALAAIWPGVGILASSPPGASDGDRPAGPTPAPAATAAPTGGSP